MEYDEAVHLTIEADNEIGMEELEIDLMLDKGLSAIEPDSASDPLADLDSMIAEGLGAKQKAREIKLARKKLAVGGITTAERDLYKQLVEEWELKREWTPAASVIMFDTQWCTNCGTSHRHFIGFYQRQDHKTSKISRWIASPMRDSLQLPREVKEITETIPVCSSCCAAAGWPLSPLVEAGL